MKEIGEYLRDERRKNGVSINEASDDLDINPTLLEAVEEGNTKAFKDIFELKDIVKNYAKYLGLDVSMIVDEFSDFIFEKTSKINLNDIKKLKAEEEKTNRVISPYTKIKHTRYDVAPIVLLVAVLLFISLVVYLGLKVATNEEKTTKELKEVGGEVIYEFAK